ncbi:MAG: ABC transporter permease [Elsteraceae bacterium]
MLFYALKRLFYVIPIAVAVGFVCFFLVHLAPGDPMSSIAPPDAPATVIAELRAIYGFDQPLPVQFVKWLGRAATGDLGRSIATGRPVTDEVLKAVSNTLILAVGATLVGFTLGCLFGGVAGYFQGSWVDKLASGLAVAGVSVPHYWLGMVLVIIFSVQLNWLPAMGAGPGGSGEWAWDLEHLRYVLLPALTLSVIPMGFVTRTVRAVIAEILNHEFVAALRAKGLTDLGVFRHIVKNAAPTALAVMGLQLGYLLGGSILVETVFSWPGTGFLLNAAIFQRDLPLLQGAILVLALFFVMLNLLVDLAQTAIDPRIKRA